jgi:hypothetical protein
METAKEEQESIKCLLGFNFSGQINNQQQNCGGWYMLAMHGAYSALRVLLFRGV